MKVIALIPAAGYGTRFHEAGPKALVLLAGKPFLVHALERLAASGRVDRAVVAAPEEHLDAFRLALEGVAIPVALTAGGLTRRDSVANALRAAAADPEDLVCVHDAARPLVDPAEVASVIGVATETGAAVAGWAMTETVKRVHGGRIVETVPRRELVGATTPQVFRASLLAAALERDTGRGEMTDDAQVVEASGFPVSVVLTSRWNLKITYPEDLVWAEAYLGRREGA